MPNPAKKRKTKPWVAVGGPWSHPDPCLNVNRIVQMVDELWRDGRCFPICPMIESHLLQSILPRSYETNLERCIDMIVGCCDAYIHLPGKSNGVKKEKQIMKKNGIPVFSKKENLYSWLDKVEKHGCVAQWQSRFRED